MSDFLSQFFILIDSKTYKTQLTVAQINDSFLMALQQFHRILLSLSLVNMLFFLFFIITTHSQIGLIAFFNRNCPDGWDSYAEGQDRFILIGNQTGQIGGNMTKTLSQENLPSHFHYLFAGIGGGGRNYYSPTRDQYAAPGAVNNYVIMGTDSRMTEAVGRSDSTGNSTPFDIMPPYIKLRACIKVQEDYITRQSLSNVTTYVETKTEIIQTKSEIRQTRTEIYELQTQSDTNLIIGIIALVLHLLQITVAVAIWMWKCHTQEEKKSEETKTEAHEHAPEDSMTKIKDENFQISQESHDESRARAEHNP